MVSRNIAMSTVLTSELTVLDWKFFIIQESRLKIIYVTFINRHLVQLGVCVCVCVFFLIVLIFII
jgi:hypothetical protein